MSPPLVMRESKFYVPCVLRGKIDLRLLALIDTGASVSGVRSSLCSLAKLDYAGRALTAYVHGSHADMEMKKYHCSMVVGERPMRLAVHELCDTRERDGGAVDALPGCDFLEDYCATPGWPRMSGRLEA